MKNLILALTAILLFLILEPVSFVYVNFFKDRFNWRRLSGYWRSFAVAVDRFGNYQYRSLFNRFLRNEQGYEFGDFRETISSALGKNERDGTLTKTGMLLVKILNKIDLDHCRKSINNFEIS
ncbi:hypothetical protein [Epilithonimonas mollis]|uniref:Uncharacterized protein n=1 Tax=Epilithonimonas mollis TaxID=216903 RepID=A0A1M6ULA0_9FLAO|nr:hypothetical protein [Epilithonimonas mollis]SHK70004.1 hypothetical protein SAMN05444371_3369 [Epilithonimonas mollis]